MAAIPQSTAGPLSSSRYQERGKKAKVKTAKDVPGPALKKAVGDIVDAGGKEIADVLKGATEVSGQLKIDPKSGNFAGLAGGHGSASWSKLIANVSGDWTSAGGFTGGKIGGGTSGGNAVLLTKGGCNSPRPETNEAHGSLTLGANNATVTVATLTCNVPSTLSATVAKFHTGDRVEIKCTSASGTNTLARVDSDHHGDH